jgi:hypothetical protein
MSFSEIILLNSLKIHIPQDICLELIKEYKHVKSQFFLRKWRPAELSGGRFCECILRAIEYLDTGSFTPFGVSLKSSDAIIRSAENNVSLSDSIRFIIPRLVRVILDFRNKRDVAHTGGEVSPNQLDSILISHTSDWILAELVRKFHRIDLIEAKKLIDSMIEIKIPIIDDINGFPKILNTKLDATEKTLLLLYYKSPDTILDTDLFNWVTYSSIGNYRTRILNVLDEKALLHRSNLKSLITRKGVLFVEAKINIQEIIL